MQLELKDGLLFTTVTLTYQGARLDIPHVLIDTGSATTVLSADTVAGIQLVPSAHDVLRTIRGVGGSEVVFVRVVDLLTVGESSLPQFEIEVGGMEYGFEINGILGMDFLVGTGALINSRAMEIEFAA